MSDPKHDMSFSEGRYLGDFDATPGESLPNPFVDAARAAVEETLANRERYVKAWVAETGIMPSEAVLEEHVDVIEGVRRFVIRRREEQLAPDPEAFKRGWEAAMKQCADRVANAERSNRATLALAAKARELLLQGAKWLESSAELHKIHEEREREKTKGTVE